MGEKQIIYSQIKTYNKMKKRKLDMGYVIASLICASNAYQFIGTNYHIPYWIWVIAAVFFGSVAGIKYIKGILPIILLLVTVPSFSQPYVGMGLQNKGAFGTIGYIAQTIDLNAQYKFPLTSATESSIFSVTVGKQFNLSHKDEDNFVLTPLVGIGFLKYGVVNKENTIIVNQSIKAVYGLEIGKDAYMGRISAFVRYVDKWYYGLSMIIFFDK